MAYGKMATLLLLALTQPGLGALINDFSTRVNSNCGATNITSLLSQSANVSGKWNPYSISLANLIRMTTDGFDTSYFEGVTIFAFAITIVFIIFTAASLIVFLLFFKWCESCSFQSTTARKVLFGFAVVLAIALIGLSIAIWALSGKTVRSLDDISCTAALIPDSTINGVARDGLNFAGLTSIASTLNTLAGEITKLDYLSPQLIVANKTSWNTDADRLDASLPMFYTVQSQVKIQNGVGEIDRPASIAAINANITDDIGVQATFLSNSLRYLNDSVSAAAFFTTVNSAKVAAAISLVSYNLGQVVDSVTETATSYLDSFDFFIGAGRKGSVVAIVVLCFTVVSVVVQAILLYFYTCTGKCSGQRTTSKCLLLLSAVCSLLLAIFTLFVLFHAFASGTLCGGLGTLLTMPSFAQFVTDNNLKVGTVSATTGMNNFVTLMDNCAIVGGSGNMASVYEGNSGTTSVFDNVIKMINGFKNFNQNRNAFQASNASASSITTLNSSLNPLRAGETFDFSSVSTGLAAFNSLVSCGGVTYAFSSTACAGSCTLITSSSIYVHNECATQKTTAQNMYLNLQKYITEEIAMIDKFREDLGVASNSPTYTPAKLYSTGFNDVLSNASLLDLSVFALAQTLASVNSITTTYTTATNCSLLRKELQMLQGAFCLEGESNNSAFFVVIIITVSLLFAFNLVMYFSLRCTGEHSDNDTESDSPAKGNQVINDKDLAKSKQN